MIGFINGAHKICRPAILHGPLIPDPPVRPVATNPEDVRAAPGDDRIEGGRVGVGHILALTASTGNTCWQRRNGSRQNIAGSDEPS
ncbi:hypothetical protein [Bradyrhizobium sp. LA6.1]|uniref:hypothetical protein n=1 Tax=Bradyrhizobium sp. LA6.1 TaxID=3156378 RepID=UPI003398855F